MRFAAIHLTAPLKKSLVAKKQAMETALAGYKAVLAYNISIDHDRGDLRDGGAVPHARPRPAGFRATRESERRRARAI